VATALADRNLGATTRKEIERQVEACKERVAGHGFTETLNPLLADKAGKGAFAL
jgi:hypothetical protein